jgi:hypothetical protein
MQSSGRHAVRSRIPHVLITRQSNLRDVGAWFENREDRGHKNAHSHPNRVRCRHWLCAPTPADRVPVIPVRAPTPRLVVRHERIECLACILARAGHPDVLEVALRGRLFVLRQVVEHVVGLVDPAPLRARGREGFGECFPKAKSAIADGDRLLVLQAALL